MATDIRSLAQRLREAAGQLELCRAQRDEMTRLALGRAGEIDALRIEISDRAPKSAL
jgi:hypothetical protein